VYPSDISREQFEHIRAELEGVSKRTKPRTVDLYEVFCGLLYVLKSGCQWRMIPSGYPKWHTIYAYFRKWNQRPSQGGPSMLERVLKNALAQFVLALGSPKRRIFASLMRRG